MIALPPVMTSLRFAWDEAKNRSNRRKHGVSFEEARTAFLRECAESEKKLTMKWG